MKEEAESVQSKMRSYGIDIDRVHVNRVAFFIDCNCLETQRVGGGPNDEGANADHLIQLAFYNSLESMNGLKHHRAQGFTV